MRVSLPAGLLAILPLVTLGLTARPAAAMEVDPDATLWHSLGNHVPVCWVDPGFAREKRIMQAAVERAFARPAPITFTWQEGCPTFGTSRWVKVKLLVPSDTRRPEVQAAQVGTTALAWPFDTWDYGVVLWVRPADPSAAWLDPRPDELACVARHAFGRVLGFRDPSGAATAFPTSLDHAWATPSCNQGVDRDGLDEGLVQTLRATYGVRPDRPTALADLDGDGRDDLIAVNPDGIYVLRSTGASFGAWARWAGPFYGALETAFADVDGDGDDDAIAVNHDGIYVLRSDGSQLTDWAPWTAFPFWGDRRTLFGDVDGDGRADAVAITTDHVWVMRSDGTGFTDLAWWGWRTGDAATSALADHDGDGRADLVTQDTAGPIEVRRSTGAGFASATPWLGAPTTAARGLHVADGSGDGRADAIVIGHGFALGYDATTVAATWIYPDLGVTWPGYPRGPFTLPAEARTTLVGDVDGDGAAEVVSCSEDGVDVQPLRDDGPTPSATRWWWGPFYSLP